MKKIIYFVVCCFMTTATAVADIRVSGVGAVTAKPDVAVVSVGVSVLETDLPQAIKRSNKRVNSLLEAIQKAGIEDKCISTSNFSVRPQTRYDKEKQRSLVVGYTVENMMTIEVHNLDEVGSVVGMLATEGGNKINNVVYTIKNKEKLKDSAMVLAVKNATHKAKLLAESAGVSLGNVKEIDEVNVGSISYPSRERFYRTDTKSNSVPFFNKDINLTVKIDCVFNVNEK